MGLHCFKKIFPLLLAAVLLCSTGITAAAQEMPDLTKTGSVSVTMRDTDSKKAVPGGSLTIYQVGEVQVYNGFSFVLTEDFAGSRFGLDGDLTAELAEKLAAYAESAGIRGTSAAVDNGGNVLFDGLELGLYLMIQPEAAEGYEPVSPFLVSVPKKEGETYVYDVDASPKMGTLTQTPVQPQKPEGTLPQTGQLNWPVPVLAILGLLLFAAGWALRFWKKDESYAA